MLFNLMFRHPTGMDRETIPGSTRRRWISPDVTPPDTPIDGKLCATDPNLCGPDLNIAHRLFHPHFKMSSKRRPRPSKSQPGHDEAPAEIPQSDAPEPADISSVPLRGQGGVARPERATQHDDDEIEWEEDYDGPDDLSEITVEEFPISYKELPTPVRKSAEAFFQRSTGFTCVRLERGSHAAYIVEIGDDLARELDCPPISLTLAPSGMLIEVARAIHPGDLPTQVQQTMARHYGNVQFDGGEEVTMHFYELAYTVGGETRVVQVDSSGVILSDEPV
jgi:hypothetical protein